MIVMNLISSLGLGFAVHNLIVITTKNEELGWVIGSIVAVILFLIQTCVWKMHDEDEKLRNEIKDIKSENHELRNRILKLEGKIPS